MPSKQLNLNPSKLQFLDLIHVPEMEKAKTSFIENQNHTKFVRC